MPIHFDAQSKTFKLDTVHCSYLLRVHETGRLLQVYYGNPIPDATVFEEGGYELDVARFEKGTGEALVEASLEVLNSLKSEE